MRLLSKEHEWDLGIRTYKPTLSRQCADLVQTREMYTERIRGEVPKLGIAVSKRTIQRY